MVDIFPCLCTRTRSEKEDYFAGGSQVGLNRLSDGQHRTLTIIISGILLAKDFQAIFFISGCLEYPLLSPCCVRIFQRLCHSLCLTKQVNV